MALAGMDPLRYLTSTDDVERLVMDGIAMRHREATERNAQNLAALIANAVGKMLGGKKS